MEKTQIEKSIVIAKRRVEKANNGIDGFVEKINRYIERINKYMPGITWGNMELILNDDKQREEIKKRDLEMLENALVGLREKQYEVASEKRKVARLCNLLSMKKAKEERETIINDRYVFVLWNLLNDYRDPFIANMTKLHSQFYDTISNPKIEKNEYMALRDSELRKMWNNGIERLSFKCWNCKFTQGKIIIKYPNITERGFEGYLVDGGTRVIHFQAFWVACNSKNGKPHARWLITERQLKDPNIVWVPSKQMK